MHDHSHAEPAGLHGLHQSRHRQLRWHPDEQLVGHRTVVGRFTDDVQGDDIRPATADRGGERAQLTWLIGHVDMQPP